MATSLAVVLFASATSAQTPNGSSRTTWQPYPAVQLGTVVPLPSAAVPSVSTRTFPTYTSPSSGPPIGSRVVVYNKPSNDVRPVQATDQVPKPAAEGGVEPLRELPTRIFTDPNKTYVFTVMTDDELFALKVPGLKDSIVNQIAELNKKEQETYRKNLEEYTKNPTGKERPQPPPRTEDYAVNLSGQQLLAPIPTKAGYVPAQMKLEPGYVVHRRLLFEEKNSERYGWELGMAQPFVSAAYFYKDVLLWPAHLMSTRERYDTSAGKCPAGSPIPYYLYPPQVTIRGGIWEAAAVVGVVMLLP